MSLLLEALKKAEKAKEEAQRRATGEPATVELRIEEEDAPPQGKPVLTRAELPDIREPLEILSDDIAPPQTPSPVQPSPSRAEAAPKAHAAERGTERAAERATAKKVFEAKFREPNPRLPFFITLGLLGAFALGTAGYFWYQLRPPSPLVNTNPVRQAGAAVQVAEVSAPAAAPASLATQASITGLPPVASATPSAAPAAAVAPAPTPAAAAPTPRAAPTRPRADPPAPRPRPAPRVARRAQPQPQPTAQPIVTPAASRRAAPPQVHPKVQTAYAAYLKGDYASAHDDYQDALREDRANRDALLGLAATEVRTGRLESAEATYLRLLQVDPNDAHAQAGLIALRASRLDPLATESRVKSMLAADPDANVLHFTLGNQLAQQGRWAEAQDAFFKAYSGSPENADFAYNLAVSLDHLRQGKLALEYYRRAVELAGRRGASFDPAAARSRAAQLEK